MTLIVNLPSPKAIFYNVYIGSGIFLKIPQILKKLQHVNKYVIITDKNIEKLYGKSLYQILKNARLNVDLISFLAGEKSKSQAVKTKIEHAMLQKKCGRDTMILALGGGVVGDMAGFVAATYMRGIPYIQIPTSFLAMVDSSIGGKVAIDTKHGKNLIGAFWHPKAIIADINFLKNLSQKQLINGLIEAIKIFLTHDADYFYLVQKNLTKILSKDGKFLQKIITRAIKLKIDVVARDEREKNERMVLNCGHTIGHAIEHLSNYTLLHGFAVALGILAESKISRLLGILSEDDFCVIEELFKKLGLHKKLLRKYDIDNMVKTTKIDKKVSDNRVKYILLEKIGKVRTFNYHFGYEVSDNIVKKALKQLTIKNEQ